MPTEATFILAGLLIVIALGGWAFGQFFDRDRDLQLPTRISPDYLRGLNLVLSRKTDEALELFIQMAKVDDDTLETHFALGHLFRRRGEVDRAIRVHQNLLARPNLNEMQRHQALHALAEDYLGAGLYDRAEKLFSELSDSETLGESALERLVYIYERESEWAKAIEMRRRLEALTGERSPQVAHYYCELAEQALKDGDLAAAREHLKGTTRSESGALRGKLIRAWIAKNEGDFAKALSLYEEIIEQDSDFVSEVLPHVFACYVAMGRGADFESFIETLLERDPRIVNDLAYSAIVADISGSPALARSVETFIVEDDVLSRLVSIDVLENGTPAEKAEALTRVAEGLRSLARSNARYRCTNCGYSTQKFIWHCPSCKLWESIKPIQRFQLESIMS
jgi:lipopolysaccharide biosynthesis regulator YciM